MSDDFGSLRSLMQRDVLDDASRAALWALMNRAWREDAEAYEGRWLEYMRDFAHHFCEPLAALQSLEELELAAKIAPHARFALELGSNDLGDAGVKALARSPHMASLTSLGLSNNGLGDGGAKALAGSPHMARLTELDVSSNLISDEGIEALKQSRYLDLERLDLIVRRR